MGMGIRRERPRLHLAPLQTLPLLELCRHMPHVLGLRCPVPSSCETCPRVLLLLGLRRPVLTLLGLWHPVPLLLRLWHLVLLALLMLRCLVLLSLGTSTPHTSLAAAVDAPHRSPLLLCCYRWGRGYRPILAFSPHPPLLPSRP